MHDIKPSVHLIRRDEICQIKFKLTSFTFCGKYGLLYLSNHTENKTIFVLE